jgi:hypothetical protein
MMIDPNPASDFLKVDPQRAIYAPYHPDFQAIRPCQADLPRVQQGASRHP